MNKKLILILTLILTVLPLGACDEKTKDKLINNKDLNIIKDENVIYFPKFSGEDFKGNKVNNDIFKNADLTIVNFWFNECPACVSEIPILQNLNHDYIEDKKAGESNIQIIGINVNVSGKSDRIEKAKKIIEEKKGKYTNISLEPSEGIDNFIKDIMGFPITVFVNSNGEIVGDPVMGALDKDSVVYFKQDVTTLLNKELEKKNK